MSETATSKTTPAPVHRFAIAAVAAGGAATGQGIGAGHRKPKKAGKYALTYSPKFTAAPALVLTSRTGRQTQMRVNPDQEAGDSDRKQGSWVDAFRLDFPAKGKKNPVEQEDAGFSAVAAVAGGSGPLAFHLQGASSAEVLVVAGAIDGVGNLSAALAYGGFTFDTAGSRHGHYAITFPAGAFDGTPVVVAAPWSNDEKIRTIDVAEVSAGGAQFDVRNENGERVAASFQFLAVGKAQQGKGTATGRLVTGVVHRDGRTELAGSGFKASVVDHPANYKVQLDKAHTFGQKPVVVVSAEHVATDHVRQAQVHGVDLNTFYVDLLGYEKGGEPGWNDCAYHFIAYAPT